MGRYLMANLNGGIIDATQVISSKGIDTLHRTSGHNVPRYGYGFGWATDRAAPPGFFSHEGVTPNFSNAMVIDPE